MVKLLSALFVSSLVVCSNCFGQAPGDTLVYLSNYGSHRPIFFFDGRTNYLAPAGTLVEVLARPLGNNFDFVALDKSGGDRLSVITMHDEDSRGFFDGEIGVVPGVKARDSAEFIIRAWRGAKTWEQALTNAFAFVGQSTIFTNNTGVYPPVPGFPDPGILTNAPSFTMYPFPEACRLVPFVGPRPLCIAVSANEQGLAFAWADLGTNYVYTLEFKPSLTATNWTPVPGITWPAPTNQFTLSNPPAAPSFYRVRAQLAQ